MLCALFAGSVAYGQGSYYAEEYIKHSGKLSAKIYVSYTVGNYKSRSEGYNPGFGIPARADEIPYVTIVRQDSMKSFSLDRKTKTYSTITLPMRRGDDVFVNGNSAKAVAERLGATDKSLKKEFLGTEIIEGYECSHYRYTTSDRYSEYWIYEPLKLAVQRMEGNEIFILRNIRQGPQPESLFEIPKDYKRASGDLGELQNVLDMMQGTGTAGEAMKQQQQKQQEQQKKSDAIKNDPNKSEQQKIMELLNQMGGDKKKK